MSYCSHMLRTASTFPLFLPYHIIVFPSFPAAFDAPVTIFLFFFRQGSRRPSRTVFLEFIGVLCGMFKSFDLVWNTLAWKCWRILRAMRRSVYTSMISRPVINFCRDKGDVLTEEFSIQFADLNILVAVFGTPPSLLSWWYLCLNWRALVCGFSPASTERNGELVLLNECGCCWAVLLKMLEELVLFQLERLYLSSTRLPWRMNVVAENSMNNGIRKEWSDWRERGIPETTWMGWENLHLRQWWARWTKGQEENELVCW